MSLAQETNDVEAAAAAFLSEEKGVADVTEALQGARDIIAELVSEDTNARAAMRALFLDKGMCESKVAKGKEEEGAKFKDYFDWSEAAAKAPSHRLLAMFRGENEGVLSLTIAPAKEEAQTLLSGLFVKAKNAAAEQVALAAEDSYTRLLGPSMETEVRAELKKRADTEAIRIFAENLRELLLAPPLGRAGPCSGPGVPYRVHLCALTSGNYSTMTWSTSQRAAAARDGQESESPSGPSAPGHRHRQRHGRPRNRSVRARPRPECRRTGRHGQRIVPPSTRPPRSPARNSRQGRHRGAVSIGRRLTTRWRNWSRSIRNPSVGQPA